MSAKAFAKLGRCRITASDGPRVNGGGVGVADDEAADGACIGIAEAAGGVVFDAAGAEAAGGGVLLEQAAQVKPSNATAESFTNKFMSSPGNVHAIILIAISFDLQANNSARASQTPERPSMA